MDDGSLTWDGSVICNKFIDFVVVNICPNSLTNNRNETCSVYFLLLVQARPDVTNNLQIPVGAKSLRLVKLATV